MNWIEIVSLLASFASIAAFMVFLYFSLGLWLKKRELSKRIISLKGSEVGLSKQPLAMVIGAGKDMIATVEVFLNEMGWRDVPVIAWKSGSKWLEPKDYREAMVNINELKDQAMKAGATEILLFYGGPIDLAIYVGARLQNWVPVRIFQLQGKEGEHLYRCTITLEKDAAGMEKIAEQLVEKL
ncbi:hypothetical protein ASZ90_011685 [hydrocarbon metagenome]|uniref:Uncharacterized protein n=1 Tax=hydrocarbon metagenome TaxID=938273 RepID=A0A0W8FCN4_9ZZZZ